MLEFEYEVQATCHGALFFSTFSISQVVSGRSEADFDGVPLLRGLRRQVGDLAGRYVVLPLDEAHDARSPQLAVAAEVARGGEGGVAAEGVAAAAEDRRARVHVTLILKQFDFDWFCIFPHQIGCGCGNDSCYYTVFKRYCFQANLSYYNK